MCRNHLVYSMAANSSSPTAGGLPKTMAGSEDPIAALSNVKEGEISITILLF